MAGQKSWMRRALSRDHEEGEVGRAIRGEAVQEREEVGIGDVAIEAQAGDFCMSCLLDRAAQCRGEDRMAVRVS